MKKFFEIVKVLVLFYFAPLLVSGTFMGLWTYSLAVGFIFDDKELFEKAAQEWWVWAGNWYGWMYDLYTWSLGLL